MICPECRHDNIEGVDFCANCGHDLYGLDQSDAPGADRTGFIHEKLSIVPSKAPVKVQTTDPVGLAVRMMQHSDTSCVLVMNGGQMAGIITPWDILHKVAGPTEDLNAVTCGQVMTGDPVYLRENEDIAVAINKMSIGGFRHIPLLQDGTPTSVVSIGDLFQHIAQHLV
jgi:CBS domain-containing protein